MRGSCCQPRNVRAISRCLPLAAIQLQTCSRLLLQCTKATHRRITARRGLVCFPARTTVSRLCAPTAAASRHAPKQAARCWCIRRLYTFSAWCRALFARLAKSHQVVNTRWDFDCRNRTSMCCSLRSRVSRSPPCHVSCFQTAQAPRRRMDVCRLPMTRTPHDIMRWHCSCALVSSSRKSVTFSVMLCCRAATICWQSFLESLSCFSSASALARSCRCSRTARGQIQQQLVASTSILCFAAE